MARPLRIEYSGAWYHVMNRSRKGTDLFITDKDHYLFLDLLKETSSIFNLKIAGYCLMSNHYHLLVNTPDGNLSRCMRHINGIYTQKYNITHDKDGTLFKGRYKSIIVNADSYLLELLRYIHRNPLKAGMSKSLEYNLSSHSGYLSKAKKWDWLYKEFIYSLINKNSKFPVSAYKTYMSLSDSEEITNFFLKKSIPSVFGSDVFIEWLKSKFSKDKTDIEINDTKILAPVIDKIIDEIAKYYRVDRDSLVIQKRGIENEPRNLAIYLSRYLRSENLMVIGKKFNLKRYSSVSGVIDRVNKKLAIDKKFKKRHEKIIEILRKRQR